MASEASTGQSGETMLFDMSRFTMSIRVGTLKTNLHYELIITTSRKVMQCIYPRIYYESRSLILEALIVFPSHQPAQLSEKPSPLRVITKAHDL